MKRTIIGLIVIVAIGSALMSSTGHAETCQEYYQEYVQCLHDITTACIDPGASPEAFAECVHSHSWECYDPYGKGIRICKLRPQPMMGDVIDQHEKSMSDLSTDPH